MIYTMGETVMDLIIQNGKPVSMVPGGAMLNSCISLGRLGVPTAFISEFGNDPAGGLVIDFLEKNGIMTDYVYRYEDGKTTLALAFLDENNDASYSFYQDFPENRLQIGLPPFTESDILLFGSFFALNLEIRPTLMKIIQKARQSGTLVLYDPNFRSSHLKELPALKPVIMENMALADFIRGSDEDFSNIFGANTPGEAHDTLPATCKGMVYTSSSRQVTLFTLTEMLELPVPKVDTVSTVGAGDTFNAGIAYGLHKRGITRDLLPVTVKQTWTEILQTAMQMSADVCLHYENYISVDLADKLSKNKM